MFGIKQNHINISRSFNWNVERVNCSIEIVDRKVLRTAKIEDMPVFQKTCREPVFVFL